MKDSYAQYKFSDILAVSFSLLKFQKTYFHVWYVFYL